MEDVRLLPEQDVGVFSLENVVSYCMEIGFL